MKKVLLLILSILVLLRVPTFSQTNSDSILIIAEDFILNNQIDSAQHLIADIEQNDHHKLLNKIIKGEILSYKEQLNFIKTIQPRLIANDAGLQEYLARLLITPQERSEINIEYVQLRFIQVSSLRNDNKIVEANFLNDGLRDYIESFNGNAIEVKRAKVYQLIHGQVVAMIQNKGAAAERMGLEIRGKAEDLKDTTLLIAANYHLFNAYGKQDELEKAIQVTREAKRLDELREEKSIYYYYNLQHLVDILMHSQGLTQEVKKLIEILYRNENSRLNSYEVIARGMGESKEDKESLDFLLNLVEEENVVDFAEKAVQETKGVVYDFDLYYVYNACAYMLKTYGEYDLAMKYMSDAVRTTRKVFSEDLSKSLANYESNQVRRENELAVAYEKKQGKLYALIAILAAGLLVIAVFAFVKKQKQAKLLVQKNAEIEKALNEKQLLLKEVHHRVKNNFQIISSLLELQSKGIEDKKARELAAEGKNRVKSMALIHQKLYQNDDLLIHFAEYIERLVEEISKMYGERKNTKMTYDIQDVSFDIDTAIPLGLIVNELITNAFKYGGNADHGTIDVSIRKKDLIFYELKVKDNGKGMPEDYDLAKARSVGLSLVKSLTKQLHGNVNYKNTEGAIFTVLFKNSEARRKVQ